MVGLSVQGAQAGLSPRISKSQNRAANHAVPPVACRGIMHDPGGLTFGCWSMQEGYQATDNGGESHKKGVRFLRIDEEKFMDGDAKLTL